MKRTICLALSLALCSFTFGDIVGPTKNIALSLDTTTTTLDIFALFGKRAAQFQLVNDSAVDFDVETNQVSFTANKIPVKTGESVKIPLGDSDRERIDTIIVTSASGSGNVGRLLVTLWF